MKSASSAASAAARRPPHPAASEPERGDVITASVSLNRATSTRGTNATAARNAWWRYGHPGVVVYGAFLRVSRRRASLRWWTCPPPTADQSRRRACSRDKLKRHPVPPTPCVVQEAHMIEDDLGATSAAIRAPCVGVDAGRIGHLRLDAYFSISSCRWADFPIGETRMFNGAYREIMISTPPSHPRSHPGRRLGQLRDGHDPH